jgi:hypothetical protein
MQFILFTLVIKFLYLIFTLGFTFKGSRICFFGSNITIVYMKISFFTPRLILHKLLLEVYPQIILKKVLNFLVHILRH